MRLYGENNVYLQCRNILQTRITQIEQIPSLLFLLIVCIEPKNAVFFQENEELAMLKRSFSSQKTSFSCEKTLSFFH